MTKPESTSWRDEALSARHRSWGHNAPVCDIDWIVVEYDQRLPVALIDYKLGLNYETLSHERANLATLAALASGYAGPRAKGPLTEKDVQGLPFIVVSYQLSPWRFKITPYNDAAKAVVPEATWNLLLNEERFVRFLYWIRGSVPPDDVLQTIRSTP